MHYTVDHKRNSLWRNLLIESNRAQKMTHTHTHNEFFAIKNVRCVYDFTVALCCLAVCCYALFGHCWCKPRNNFNGLLIFEQNFVFVHRRLHRYIPALGVLRSLFSLSLSLSFYLIYNLIAIWYNKYGAHNIPVSPIEFGYILNNRSNYLVLWYIRIVWACCRLQFTEFISSIVQ